MADFYTMQAEVFAARNQPKLEKSAKPRKAVAPVKPTTMYLVAAWHRDGYWKVHRETNLDEFFDRDAAERFASSLSSVWHERRIIEIKLGEIPT